MTLALLLTAVGGAWAQDVDYDIDVDFDSRYNPNETPFHCMIMKMGSGAEIKGTLDLSVDGASKGSFPVNGDMFMGNITPGLDAGEHTWSAEFKPEGGGSFKGNGSFRIKKAYTSIYYNGSTSINLGVGESTELDVLINPSEAGVLSYSSSDASVASIAKKENSYKYIIEAKAVGTATITFSCAGSTNYNAAEDVKITVTVSTPPIKVTTDAAEEGATFTEASFLMPTDDVTVNYELVRDMSVKMSAEVGDGSDGYRIRIKKDGNDYVPVNIEDMLISVTDELDGQHDLTVNTDFTLLVQKKGEGDTWTDLSNEDKLSVGTFRYKVTGVGNYDGTIYSNEFKLFEGYELKIAAGEYVTYYKDEALYVEDEDAKLYTITTVGNETATATELTVAAANTPLLVKNNAAEAKTILLIPTTNATPDDVTPYEGFKGTLQATQIAASNATQNNYALNGKEFVWVMDAIDIAANRAWLEIPAATTNGRALQIVFGDVTGMSEELRVKSEEFATAQWYDLNGRKLQAAPTKKGVYILNGKKVIVR